MSSTDRKVIDKPYLLEQFHGYDAFKIQPIDKRLTELEALCKVSVNDEGIVVFPPDTPAQVSGSTLVIS